MSNDIIRCDWCNNDDLKKYHDEEWGQPTLDDFLLFEKICLEGFQSGLSWLTILRKREEFRKVFKKFNFYKISLFDNREVGKLMANEKIIRHRGKIEATINNANKAVEIVKEFGSFSNYIWKWKPEIIDNKKSLIPSKTKESEALSNDLKSRGWKFFGPTTSYAFMQAMGMVNDHTKKCFMKEEINIIQSNFKHNLKIK